MLPLKCDPSGILIFGFQYELGQRCYAPQARPNRGFKLMTSRSWQYISCHWDTSSNHSAISVKPSPTQQHPVGSRNVTLISCINEQEKEPSTKAKMQNNRRINLSYLTRREAQKWVDLVSICALGRLIEPLITSSELHHLLSWEISTHEKDTRNRGVPLN